MTANRHGVIPAQMTEMSADGALDPVMLGTPGENEAIAARPNPPAPA